MFLNNNRDFRNRYVVSIIFEIEKFINQFFEFSKPFIIENFFNKHNQFVH